MNSRSERFGLIPIENSVWINPRSDWFGLIWIENLVSNWFGFIRIDVLELIGLSRIDFWPFFIKRDTKCFSDWFGMIRIGSDTDIGMNKNSSDWLGMNFNPIISESKVGEIRIDSDWKFGWDQSEIGLIRVDLDWKLDFGLVQIHSDWCLRNNRIRSDWFLTVFHQMRYKTFFGLVRNDSHWLRYRYQNESE